MFEGDSLGYLPCFALWEAWKARNISLFSNFNQKAEVIYVNILSTFLERSKEISEKGKRCLSCPLFEQDYPMAFFDGAASNRECGAGFVIKLEK